MFFPLRSRAVEARKLAIAVFPASVQFRAGPRLSAPMADGGQDTDATSQRRRTGSQDQDAGRMCSCTQHASGKPESHIHLTSNDLYKLVLIL